jgi:hypothetical protein
MKFLKIVVNEVRLNFNVTPWLQAGAAGPGHAPAGKFIAR